MRASEPPRRIESPLLYSPPERGQRGFDSGTRPAPFIEESVRARFLSGPSRLSARSEVHPETGVHHAATEPLDMTTAALLRGEPIARRLRSETSASVQLLRDRAGIHPVLATVLVGAPPSALAYRQAIERSANEVGIVHRPIVLASSASADRLTETIQALNEDPQINGVVVLMPLPSHLSPELVFEHLVPTKDVDGITPTNAGRLHLGLPSLRPSTPQGGIEILDHYAIPIAGQHAVVVGRSNVVGRPLATLLSLRDATVTICHRQTCELAAVTRDADIVAVAAGRPGLIRGDMLKPGAVVIDFGANAEGGKLVGDAEAASVAGVAAAYTPVPGGTGPVTTLVLVRNTVAAAFAVLASALDHADLPAPAGSGSSGTPSRI